jgi:pectate lyase
MDNKTIIKLIPKALMLSFYLLAIVSGKAQSVSISEWGGWFEKAWATWAPPATKVDRYNVYYSGNGAADVLIDDQLIRSYGTYWRADIPGLSAGTYTIKIVPVVSGSEKEAATTPPVQVMPHERSGFAFMNGKVPGGYKADGTPKDGAVIIYITENTKNTVSVDVTGANSNPCVGLQAILDGLKKGNDTRPFIFRMVGEITDFEFMYSGDIVIENKNNPKSYITLEGIGEDATANGWGIRLKNANNIEIRNIGTMNCDSNEGDNIGLQQNNEHIWVHNCDFFYGHAGSDSDQAKGDGALDCKKSTRVTFSYNHFWDTGKSNLLGLSEGFSDDLLITYHHNWYDHSDSRHPRVRYYSAHIYNNYYDGISKYGVGSTMGSSLFVEGNYFRNCRYPMLTSMQGTDISKTWDQTTLVTDAGNLATFSNEDGGVIKAYNNYMEDQRQFVAYGSADYHNSNAHYDAYVVSSKTQTVPSSVKSFKGGHIYNNFDTNPLVMYSYTAQSPEDAKKRCMQYAGRMNGGDFSWTFNNAADDASYAVNQPLKDSLLAYSTKLQYIQGDGEHPKFPPAVIITSPVAGAKYNLGQPILIEATAQDPDGAILTVAFYSILEGTETLIGAGSNPPYQTSWTPNTAGNYAIYALATDNDGLTGASATNFYVTIYDPLINNAPIISSISTESAIYIENSDIEISVTATDDNAVTRVEFYNGASLLHTAAAEPYIYTLASAAIGSYTIKAIAYDAGGLSAEASCRFEVVELNESDLVHNFTVSGTASSFFAITGNLSSSKGTVQYNGLTLTQCLKIESSTNISFATSAESNLALVFISGFSGRIYINGTRYFAANGILSVTLPAGQHIITKDDTADLFYMSITYTPGDKTSQTIELHEGWNLISTNIETEDISIANIFSGLELAEIKNMDAFWRKGQPAHLNSLQTIRPGKAYLVKMESTGTLSVSGIPAATDNTLPAAGNGWQLIGCPYQSAVPFSTYFDAANPAIIKNFKGFWSPSGDGPNSINSFEPGNGYMLKKQ